MEGEVETALSLVFQGERFLYGNPPNPEEARRLFDAALTADYRCLSAKTALKALRWWCGCFESAPAGGAERGSYLMSRWDAFYRFLHLADGGRAKCKDGAIGAEGRVKHEDGAVDADRVKAIDPLRAVRSWVCREAVGAFAYNPLDPSQNGNAGLLWQLGLAHKGSGDYQSALEFLKASAGLKPPPPALLFELADVTALLGDERGAEVMMRQAFFMDPLAVDEYSMESALFCDLLRAVRERGYEGDELLEWMPVWGTLLRTFTVRRELSQAELGRLNAEVFELETALKSWGAKDAALKALRTPRLLNKYFWLVEHYERTEAAGSGGREKSGGSHALFKDTLLKIKYIDEFIHDQFVKL
jgi:tetratricopeptide (TPR) repeat protein